MNCLALFFRLTKSFSEISYIVSIISLYKQLVFLFDFCLISHARRDANHLAHTMVKTVKSSSVRTFLDVVPLAFLDPLLN